MAVVTLKVVCFAYLIFTILGRIVNYDTCSGSANGARLIDNITIVMLVLIINFL